MMIARTDKHSRAQAIARKAALRRRTGDVRAPAAAGKIRTACAALLGVSLGAMAWAQEVTEAPEIGSQTPELSTPADLSGPAPSPAADLAAPVNTNPPATPATGAAREDPAPEAPSEAAVPQTSTELAPAGRAAKNGSDGASSAVGKAQESKDTGPEIVRTQSRSERLPEPEATPGDLVAVMKSASDRALTFLRNGGPAIWAIAALSVATCALILWKVWRLALLGAWSRGKSGQAVEAYLRGERKNALALVEGRRGIRSQVMATTLRSLQHLSADAAREETARVAKRQLASARDGLGALELIATVAPLLGLLGTVLGMIAAFQALQAASSRADPALLAGGIWEALLTTAAGMAVAIPASAALTWFEAVVERVRRDIEDNAVRVFVASQTESLKLAAE